jgi:hypothetical protein
MGWMAVGHIGCRFLFGKHSKCGNIDGFGFLVFMKYKCQFLLNYNENGTIVFALKMRIQQYKECRD